MNNKLKKNQDGFTLVELIVVVALMAIVFGALMNVIKPTNQFFQDSEAFKDEVMISEGLTDALADEIRYATNVVVLQNYVGVPKLSIDGQLEGIPDITFDSAILIENDKVRGSLESDYLTNMESTAARRKRAKGQIVVFEIGGIGINFNVSNILYNEDYYGDYQYEFTATGKNDENGRAYIDFGVTMNDLVQNESGDYQMNEDNYESSEFLYLKNINLNDNDGYKLYVKDFNGSTNNDDYIGFERATATTATAASTIQTAMFNGSDSNNVHTWIIYYKGSSVDAAENVQITFDPGVGGSTSVTCNVKTGKAINMAPPSLPEPGYADYTGTDGKTYTRRFLGWTSTTNPTDEPLTNEQLMAYVAMADETFVAQYEDTDATYDVMFYDSNGIEMGGGLQTVLHGESVTPPDMSATVPTDYEGYVWKLYGSINDIVDPTEFAFVTRDLYVEPYYFNLYDVTFQDENGNVIEKVSVMGGTDCTNVPDVPEKAGYAGEWMRLNDDGTTQLANFGAVSEDLIIVPQYTEIPVAKPVLQISNVACNANQWWRTTVSFKISNVGEAPTTGFKITIPMTENITLVEGDWALVNGLGAKVSYSGTDIIIDGTGVTLNPGVTYDVSLTATPGAATTTGDPIVTEVK